MTKLQELRQALGKAVDELNSPEIIADAELYKKKEAEIEGIRGQITRTEAAQRQQASLARPSQENDDVRVTDVATGRTLGSLVAEAREFRRTEGRKATFEDCISIARKGLDFQFDAKKHFRSFGEQLQAIAAHYYSKGTNTDSRLERAPTDSMVTRAPSGASEMDPSSGGFLVQVDIFAAIYMLAHDMGEILSRVGIIPISGNSNGLKIPGVDETSRATGSRWGGVQSNWAAEGVSGPESRPKFRMIEFDLKKLISKMTVTDEMLADSTALTAIAMKAFSEEVMFMTEDAIVEGSGAGQPLGFLNSKALVTVAKQTGQAAATIVKENIDAMWSRMWSRSRKGAIWTVNQDIEPQLNALNGAVGTGGQLVYLPPGGIANAPNASLYGRPLIATEYNAALGTPGDIALIDLEQYTLIDKGGVQMATSMHVAFDTDEMRFRITYRVDGRPMWANQMTPFKGTLTKSPFVALAAR